jgi:tetratricopeptide (TPR) repeat protein
MPSASASGFIQTMQLHEKAMKAHKAGDLPGAIEAAEAELEIVVTQMAGAPIHKGRVLPFLGGLYLEAGRFADAETVFEQALEIRIEEVGATSGDVASLHSRIGECRVGQGQYDQAIGFFEQAIAIFKSKDQRFDLSRASTMEHLSIALSANKREDEAQVHKKAAMKIYSRQWGDDDPRTAKARVRLGL